MVPRGCFQTGSATTWRVRPAGLRFVAVDSLGRVDNQGGSISGSDSSALARFNQHRRRGEFQARMHHSEPLGFNPLGAQFGNQLGAPGGRKHERRVAAMLQVPRRCGNEVLQRDAAFRPRQVTPGRRTASPVARPPDKADWQSPNRSWRRARPAIVRARMSAATARTAARSIDCRVALHQRRHFVLNLHCHHLARCVERRDHNRDHAAAGTEFRMRAPGRGRMKRPEDRVDRKAIAAAWLDQAQAAVLELSRLFRYSLFCDGRRRQRRTLRPPVPQSRNFYRQGQHSARDRSAEGGPGIGPKPGRPWNGASFW